MKAPTKRKIKSGIYLVLDPSMEELILLNKLSMCLKEELAAVQIWDNFKSEENVSVLIKKICELCHTKNIPVLINNKWELLNNSLLDGVHFDNIPKNYDEIKESINKDFICGLTCNNDLSFVHWANENKLDYISFCSIFPSTTSNSCELVNFETIQRVSKLYSLPIFLAGGIKPENIYKLSELKYNGIAVVSGIMSSEKPNEAIKKYQSKLNHTQL